MDQLFAWPRVSSVAADDDSLVVRVDAGTRAEDALLLRGVGGSLALTVGSSDPRTVAAPLDQARLGQHGTEPPRFPRRPSTPVLVGAAWLTTAVVAGFAGR